MTAGVERRGAGLERNRRSVARSSRHCAIPRHSQSGPHCRLIVAPPLCRSSRCTPLGPVTTGNATATAAACTTWTVDWLSTDEHAQHQTAANNANLSHECMVPIVIRLPTLAVLPPSDHRAALPVAVCVRCCQTARGAVPQPTRSFDRGCGTAALPPYRRFSSNCA